jgi:hypothetical protein
MYRRIVLTLLLVGLLSPIVTLAQTPKEQFILSQPDTQSILKNISTRLTEFGTLNFVSLSPEEQLAIFLARNELKKSYINFLPGFLSTETLKLIISGAKVFQEISEITLSEAILKIERYTVNEAVRAGTDWLIGNKVQTSSGELSTTYEAHFGGKTEATFQYFILYKSNISGPSRNLLFEFRSPDYISPPWESSVRRLPWEKGDWLSKNEDKIRPFILRVETSADENSGWYIRPEGIKVAVEFPEKVPKLELTKELPYPIEEQKINLLNKLTAIKQVFDTLGGAGIELFNTLGKGVGMVKQATEAFFSFFSQIVAFGGAGVIDPFKAESQGFDLIQSKLNQVKEQLATQDQNVVVSKDEIDPVENLAKPNFPQIEPVLDIVKKEPNSIKEKDNTPPLKEKQEELDSVKDAKNAQKGPQARVFAGCSDGQININTAHNELLQEIVQIGETRAERIIEARASELFYSIQELERISGIGQGIVSQIKKQGLACVSFAHDASFQHFQKTIVSGGGGGSGNPQSASQSKEGAGDLALCSQEDLESPVYTPIIINEVAWMGTTNSSNDEWIELKNISDKQVSLGGWQLLDKAEQIQIVFEATDIISAGGFYLLERTDDASVPGIPMDKSYAGALSNTEESLRLFNSKCDLIDEALASPSWPAGDNMEKRSMERTAELAWVTYLGGENSGILGTPKEKNNYEEPESQGEATDAIPPWVEFSALSLIQEDIVFDVAWDGGDVTDAVASSGLDGFSLSYTISPFQDGVFLQYQDGDNWINWKQDAPGVLQFDSSINTISVSGKDGFSYIFSVIGKDKAGNESEEDVAQTSVDLTKTVVISEIAWMGTQASSFDGWIEFYNTSTQEVDLTDWSIYGGNTGECLNFFDADNFDAQETNAQFLISSGEYLLYGNSPDVAKDQSDNSLIHVWDATLGLNNSSPGRIQLFNQKDCAGAVIDEVNQAESDWFAGTSSPHYISMERIDVTKAGSNSSNWANNNLITHNGKDAEGGNINGTPGQLNSIAYSSTTVINTAFLRFDEFDEITLAFLGSPYEMLGNIEVPLGKILIVEPGVIIRLKGGKSHVIIHGTLLAVGSADNMIVFTDGADKNFGNWCGFSFPSTSINSQLEFVNIEQSASVTPTCGALGKTYALLVEGTNVAIKNSKISNGSNDNKLYLRNSNSTIDSLTITGDTTKTAFSAGVYIEGGSPIIANSTIKDSSIGIFAGNSAEDSAALPTIINNTFLDNTYAITVAGTDAVLSGNSATGNTYNGIWVKDSISSANAVWEADTIPYILNHLGIETGATLTIEPGVVVKFVPAPISYTELYVYGTLKAEGTVDSPITFTFITDESVASGTLGAGGVPVNIWRRMHFFPTSTGSVLSNTIIKHAGSIVGGGAVSVEGELELHNVTIQDGPNVGIYVSGMLTGSGITLTDNAYAFHIATMECPALTNVVMSSIKENFYSSPAECVFE